MTAGRRNRNGRQSGLTMPCAGDGKRNGEMDGTAEETEAADAPDGLILCRKGIQGKELFPDRPGRTVYRGKEET